MFLRHATKSPALARSGLLPRLGAQLPLAPVAVAPAAAAGAQRAFGCAGSLAGGGAEASSSSSAEPAQKKRRLPEYAKMQSAYRTKDSREAFSETKQTLKELGLPTVCEEAKCPNLNECWGEGTATIMILGDTCTRACRFCSVKTSKTGESIEDGGALHDEPQRVSSAVAKWEKLKYVVVTCVDRDDLMDFGALHIKKTVELLKQIRRKKETGKLMSENSIARNPNIFLDEALMTEMEQEDAAAQLAGNAASDSQLKLDFPGAEASGDGPLAEDSDSDTQPLLVETLLGDFRGDLKMLEVAMDGGMDVFAHNIETVERLQSTVRDRRANYAQSMKILGHVQTVNAKRAREGKPAILSKSSIMLGLGETREEIEQCLRDLRSVGCNAVTLGQYLKPSWKHMPVHRYLSKEEYADLGRTAKGMGFDMVASGPMVRSSYRAGELFLSRIIEQRRGAGAAA